MIFGDIAFAQDVEADVVAQEVMVADSLVGGDSLKPRRARRSMLDDVMRGKNKDSLYYDVVGKRIYIYNEGDVTYQNKNLKADNMQIDMTLNEIHDYGSQKDSLDPSSITQPVFVDGGTTYTMDTITYNISSEKAKSQRLTTLQASVFHSLRR